MPVFLVVPETNGSVPSEGRLVALPRGQKVGSPWGAWGFSPQEQVGSVAGQPRALLALVWRRDLGRAWSGGKSLCRPRGPPQARNPGPR